MSLVKSKYIEAEEVSKPSKSGIRVISEMSTLRILWHIAYKHRVGLFALAALTGWGHAFHLDNVIATLIF